MKKLIVLFIALSFFACKKENPQPTGSVIVAPPPPPTLTGKGSVIFYVQSYPFGNYGSTKIWVSGVYKGEIQRIPSGWIPDCSDTQGWGIPVKDTIGTYSFHVEIRKSLPFKYLTWDSTFVLTEKSCDAIAIISNR